MSEIATRIRSNLLELQSEENIRIVYACESGSRAWGFESVDSDFDVRFVYVRDRDWYLSIDEKRDVIERPITDEIDLSGWDLKKALRLLRKSNPPLMEWLSSPIEYLKHEPSASLLRQEIAHFYSPTACMHHYLHMAEGNFREFLKRDTVWRKKYFYVLRPVLACLWVEAGKGPVPMEFQTLVDEFLNPGELLTEVSKLLELKRCGAELDQGDRIEVINEFLEQEITRLQSAIPKATKGEDQTPRLDQLFRHILETIW